MTTIEIIAKVEATIKNLNKDSYYDTVTVFEGSKYVVVDIGSNPTNCKYVFSNAFQYDNVTYMAVENLILISPKT